MPRDRYSTARVSKRLTDERAAQQSRAVLYRSPNGACYDLGKNIVNSVLSQKENRAKNWKLRGPPDVKSLPAVVSGRPKLDDLRKPRSPAFALSRAKALYFADDRHVIADFAVGQETHYADVVLFVGISQRRADRLHHLGSTVPALPFQKMLGLPQVLFGRRDGLVEQNARVSGERDEVEGVVFVQPVERKPHHSLSRFNRQTAHRARRVKNEDQFFGVTSFAATRLGGCSIRVK